MSACPPTARGLLLEFSEVSYPELEDIVLGNDPPSRQEQLIFLK